MQFALIHNARSLRNKRNRDQFAQKCAALLGERFLQPQTHDELTDFIRTMAAQRVSLIAISGGDGTVSAIMTAIGQHYPPQSLPRLAVFPSGNSNLIAHDVGFRKRDVTSLLKLWHSSPELKASFRHALEVSWPDGAHRPHLGMFYGSCGFARAITLAHSPCVVRFAPHNLAMNVTLCRIIASFLRKSQLRHWLEGEPFSLRERDGFEMQGRSIIFLATSLEKLTLRVAPFWNNGVTSGAVRYLNVVAKPKRFGAALANILSGRTPEWLKTSNDYVSRRTKHLTLDSPSRFVLDGEIMLPGPSGVTTLTQGPEFCFLHD